MEFPIWLNCSFKAQGYLKGRVIETESEWAIFHLSEFGTFVTVSDVFCQLCLSMHKLSPIRATLRVFQKQGDRPCYFLINQEDKR